MEEASALLFYSNADHDNSDKCRPDNMDFYCFRPIHGEENGLFLSINNLGRNGGVENRGGRNPRPGEGPLRQARALLPVEHRQGQFCVLSIHKKNLGRGTDHRLVPGGTAPGEEFDRPRLVHVQPRGRRQGGGRLRKIRGDRHRQQIALLRRLQRDWTEAGESEDIG